MASAWLARLLTLVVWALAIGSATVWALRHVRPEPAMAAPPAPVAVAAVAPDLQAVFGARSPASAPGSVAGPALAGSAPSPTPRPISERFALLGVVADPQSGGVALISIDGAPARPFEAGHAIEEGLRLGKVGARSATLIPKAPAKAFTIELPGGPRSARLVPGSAAPGAGPPQVVPQATQPGGAATPAQPFIRRPNPAASSSA